VVRAARTSAGCRSSLPGNVGQTLPGISLSLSTGALPNEECAAAMLRETYARRSEGVKEWYTQLPSGPRPDASMQGRLRAKDRRAT